MTTAIKVSNSRNIHISNTVIKRFKIGIDVERSFIRLRKVRIGNTLAPLVVRDFGSQIVFEDHEGLIVY
ncbi:MAG: hypothetical protein DRO14_04880 [Thermoprotei archaeon]|nr:MAG: hypothetical protein DRO14_04880 [Thermoprotei archaeon]